MAIVVPTVLATNPDDYAAMFERAQSLSPRVHVDIADGRFTDSTTIGLAQVQPTGDTLLDLHLMLEDPVAQLETALSLKPNLIIFHAESNGDLAGSMEHIRELGVKAGVGILPQTGVDACQKLVEKADHVLIFTGLLGHNDGQFQTDQLAKAEDIRAIKPGVEISVDGGVNDQNAALIVLQNIDVLYAGGYIQEADDPQEAYNNLLKQIGVSVEL